jgi:hypothetical protein
MEVVVMNRSIRLTMLSGFVLAFPLLTFGGQSTGMSVPTGAQNDVQNQYNVTRAVQWGKGTGMSRLTRTVPANSYRVQTAQEQGVVRASDYPASNATGFTKELISVQNPGDIAFRK